MGDINYMDLTAPISKEQALKLLFSNKETIPAENRFFDEFGNYSFPTELVIDTPNTAVGTPSGFSLVKEEPRKQ